MLRGRLLTVHRWLALLASLPLLLVLISGAALSFVNEFDRAMHPGLLSVAASQSLDRERLSAYITSDIETLEAELIAVRFPESSYDPIRLQLAGAGNQWLRYLNPHTGKLLGERNVVSDWGARLVRLHTSLLESGVGSLVTWSGTAVLIAMIILGISLLKKSAGWRISGWHAWLGLCAAPILLLICVSGLLSISGIAAMSSDRLELSAVDSSAGLIREIHQEMIRSCAERPLELQATVGGATLTCINGDQWLFQSDAGKLSVQRSRKNHTLLWNLHSGAWAGLPGRAFWMWSVLAVFYLLYSGLRDWFEKLRRNKQ